MNLTIIILVALILLLILLFLFLYRNISGQLASERTKSDMLYKNSNDQIVHISSLESRLALIEQRESQTIASLQQNYSQQIGALNAQHNQAIDALNLQHSSYVSSLEIQHKQSIEALTLRHNQLNDAMRKREHQLMELIDKREEQIAEDEKRNKEMFNSVFENIATKILEEKTTSFVANSSREVNRIIEPFAKELTDFKQRFENQYIETTKEQASLKVELSKLFELNHKLGEEASSLVKAIKGESNPKFQGDWGEMILEKILSSSGLVSGEHYFVQESSRNDQNEIIRPDVIIRYPDGREVIIDSKVSLSAYVRYVSAPDQESAASALSDHILSVKRHINQLSEKRYDYKTDSLDFVMMFMPVEPAYLLALASDNALWEYAYKKKIILVSPTHLITALKLVYDLWSRDAQNKNAIDIANRGALMLDKFSSFVTDMESISKNLDTTRKSYDAAMNKLSTGTGNLIRQAQMLTELGVRNTKKIKKIE